MYTASMRASVIVPSFNSGLTIERCLSSLGRQNRRDLFEILVADSSTDGTARLVESGFPDARLFHFDERKLPGEARNLAAAHALGDVLIFLDADCFVEPDWIERVIEAHSGDYAAIGGALHNGNPEYRAGVAQYLFEFSQWLPAAARREQDEIPGGCLSMKRWAFERYGPFPSGPYAEDTAFCRRLRAAGIPLLFAPSIRIFHLHTMPMPELFRAKGYHGRCFAWRRSRQMARWKRWALGALAPALPALLLWRIWRRVRAGASGAEFWKVSPLIFLLAIGWSFGEVLGYLSDREPLPHKARGSGRLRQQD